MIEPRMNSISNIVSPHKKIDYLMEGSINGDSLSEKMADHSKKVRKYGQMMERITSHNDMLKEHKHLMKEKQTHD